MRGTLQGVAVPVTPPRFIPAHAGNTNAGGIGPRSQSVHPRACGEHNSSARFASSARGSSPRMRGTPQLVEHMRQRERFIPAHAGNTPNAPALAHLRTVHPRACGEHFCSASWTGSSSGSSPRMRGTPRRGVSCAARRPVHPRACGEHLFGQASLGSSLGSSPRMRGTRVRAALVPVEDRFIPAHAGNTYVDSGTVANLSVHPRACGEHLRKSATMAPRLGSSPRMRGTPVSDGEIYDSRRFIPAHAGNTH